MMACGEEDLNDRVVCAIEECGYTSIPAIAEKQVRSAFGIATQPVLIGLSTLIKMRCGYSVWEASAVEQLRQCRVPCCLSMVKRTTLFRMTWCSKLLRVHQRKRAVHRTSGQTL